MNAEQTVIHYREYQKFKSIKYVGGKNSLPEFLILGLLNGSKITCICVKQFVSSGDEI
ncbi:MAG: hypothetical protein QXN55_02125 [Candidatus Nitrosotenuis sp.]